MVELKCKRLGKQFFLELLQNVKWCYLTWSFAQKVWSRFYDVSQKSSNYILFAYDGTPGIIKVCFFFLPARKLGHVWFLSTLLRRQRDLNIFHEHSSTAHRDCCDRLNGSVEIIIKCATRFSVSSSPGCRIRILLW